MTFSCTRNVLIRKVLTMPVAWCGETLIYMILEISGVAAKKTKTKKPKKTLVLTLIGGVIMFHWRGFWHVTHCSLSTSFSSCKSIRYQFQKTKIKSGHKLTKYKSNITHL